MKIWFQIINDLSIESVSKELNHLAAILHLYAKALIFQEVKENIIIFQKEKWKYYYTFNHCFREKLSKRAK